jgi:hypothetical protein
MYACDHNQKMRTLRAISVELCVPFGHRDCLANKNLPEVLITAVITTGSILG